MELLYIVITIVQTLAISLGIGAATLSVLNFFGAIKDGLIDDTERHLMGLTTNVLRIALSLLVITTFLQAILRFSTIGVEIFSTLFFILWTLICFLILITILTKRSLLSSTVGPGMMVASWYVLGIVLALISLGVQNFSYWQFFVGLVATMALSVSVINGFLAHLRTLKYSKN